MTTCDSHAGDGESCRIGVLFRTQDGTGERIMGGAQEAQAGLDPMRTKGQLSV